MTIEKTNDESTIITSSRSSILGAAVEPPPPSQLIDTMTADITAVRTRIAAISFASGRFRTRGILFRRPEATAPPARDSRHDRRQPVQFPVGCRDDRARHALPAPELVHPLGQREPRLPPPLLVQGEPAIEPLGELRDGLAIDREAEQTTEVRRNGFGEEQSDLSHPRVIR